MLKKMSGKSALEAGGTKLRGTPLSIDDAIECALDEIAGQNAAKKSNVETVRRYVKDLLSQKFCVATLQDASGRICDLWGTIFPEDARQSRFDPGGEDS